MSKFSQNPNSEPQTPNSWKAYVEQMAQAMELPLSPEHLPGVIDNVERIAAIATLVTEFPLPENIELAPIFRP